jgi:hypothetical protein
MQPPGIVADDAGLAFDQTDQIVHATSSRL